jgi:hypothetical protein
MVCKFTSKFGFDFVSCEITIRISLYKDDIELTKKSTVYWDMTPCHPVEIHRRFGETYCLHFQCRKISPKNNKKARRGNQMILIYYFLTYDLDYNL